MSIPSFLGSGSEFAKAIVPELHEICTGGTSSDTLLADWMAAPKGYLRRRRRNTLLRSNDGNSPLLWRDVPYSVCYAPADRCGVPSFKFLIELKHPFI